MVSEFGRRTPLEGKSLRSEEGVRRDRRNGILRSRIVVRIMHTRVARREGNAEDNASVSNFLEYHNSQDELRRM